MGIKQRVSHAVIAAACLLAAAGCGRNGDGQYQSVDEIHYTYRLENNLSRELRSAPVRLFLPFPQSSYQKVLDYRVRGIEETLYRRIQDAAGNSMLYLDLKNLPPGFSTQVRIDARIGYPEEPLAVEEPSINDYLAAGEEPAVEGAGALEDDAGEDLQARVKAVFSRLRDSATKNADVAEGEAEAAERPDSPGDSPEETEQHDETESSNLHPCLETAIAFTRAARADGLPARPVVGFHGQEGSALTSSDLHCWVDVYNAPFWRPVSLADSSLADSITGYVAVRVFQDTGELNASTLADMVHEGFGVRIQLQ